MDNILLIDLHNAIWRACVTFGSPTSHLMCATCNNNKHISELHCICGAYWNHDNGFCYGEKYIYIYNFFRNLRPIIEQFTPDKCFAVLEGRPQFRYDLYNEYKANRIIKIASRQEANKKFLQAKEIILFLIKYLPITICCAGNYEADDVIGSLSENMKEENITVISNDSDYIQLLQRHYFNIKIYNPIKKDYMVAPQYLYTQHKSLVGDKSDNIKRLVSDKKALQYCTNPNDFGKFMDLEENGANFTINRKLIEFANVPLEEIEMKAGERKFSLLKEEFTIMKFNSMVMEKSWQKYTNTFNCIKY